MFEAVMMLIAQGRNNVHWDRAEELEQVGSGWGVEDVGQCYLRRRWDKIFSGGFGSWIG